MSRGLTVAAAVAAFALTCGVVGCSGDGDTDSTGGGGSGGSGGGTSTGGGGGTSSTTSSTSSTTSSTSTTTTAPPGPCEGFIEGFTPEWKPPEGSHQGLCADEAQIAAFFTACIETGANEADCNAFTEASAENAGCAMCAVSTPEDEKYGPMTIYTMPQVLYENPGQCISEVEMDASDASCGAKVFAAIQCSVTACEKCEFSDFNDLLACLSAAEAGGCKSFVDAKNACVVDLQTAGAPIDVCLPPTSGGNPAFYGYLKEMTLFLCGP